MKKIIIITVVAVAIFFVVRYFARKGKLANNLNASISELKGTFGLSESTLDLKIKLDNPTEGEITVSKPYIIARVNGKEIGRSTPDVNQKFKVAKYASTEIPANVKVSTLQLATLLATDVPSLFNAEKRKQLLANLTLEAETMLDVDGVTVKFPLTYSLANAF